MTMTKGEEHKQKASKKTYRTHYSSVKIASNSLKYRLLFFFPPFIITPLQKENGDVVQNNLQLIC